MSEEVVGSVKKGGDGMGASSFDKSFFVSEVTRTPFLELKMKN
jgi:hypothetical protein